jgi:hypothetical protein
MEMERSGGSQSQSQSQLTHPAVDVDEAQAAALGVTKRERKRSRYLSPPYTDTGVQEKKAAGSHKQREEEEEEGPPPPHVSASEVLSALRLRATALAQGEGMDAAALRFLAIYRNKKSIFVVDDHPDSHAAAGGGGGSQDDGGNKPPSASAAAGLGRKMLNLNAGPDDGSLTKKKKKNPHPPPAAGANAKQQKDDGTMENAAVLQHAIATHGLASQSPGVAAAATHGHPNHPPVVTTVKPSVNNEKKEKRNKKRFKTIGQHSYVENPVALVLDFAEGIPLPSREDLFSTFSGFGLVIDSETTISQDKRTARVAFATRVQAEAALSSATTLGGAFGPPFAVPSLQDLPPITLNTPPPPLPKIPLTDIRNNLGKMILSLSFKATAAPQEANAKTAVDSLSLVGEMQRLLAKVNKVLQVQDASATAHHA